MASTLYNQKREESGVDAAYTVTIVFPVYGDLPSKTFYWSTTEAEFDTDGDFKGHLTEFPTGRHQADRNQDTASFVVANENNALYQELLPYEDLLERAECTIRECLHIDGGYYESEVRFYGYLQDFTLNESDKSLHFTVASDLSRTGYLVGGIILTRDRCRHEFNVNGLRAPDDFSAGGCTWQVIQGGNPLYCSRFRKGADGCEAHLNTHQIGLLDGYSSANVEIVDSNPSGFPYETGACFTETVYVLMANRTIKPINQVYEGDSVLSFDLFDSDKLKPSKVTHKQIHQVKEIVLADFGSVTLETTREHLFYIGERYFAPVGFLEGREVSGINKQEKWLRSRLNALTPYIETAFVYNLTTEHHTYFVTDSKGKTFLAVHNLKPNTPVG